MMYGLDDRTIDKINTVFAEFEAVHKVMLYGSRAKGNYRPASDIDLTLVGEGLTLDIHHKIAGKIDDLSLPYSFDLSVFKQIENESLIEHIQWAGKVFYERDNEQCLKEWKEYKLKDVATILTGFPFKGHKYTNEGVRVLRGENVTIGSLRWDTIKCWNELFPQKEKYSLKAGDIVIGMDGSRVGKNRAQVREEELPLLLAQRVACVRSNYLSNQDFLAHIIKSKTFESYVSAVQTGTSIPHISQRQIEEFVLELPGVGIQRRIASILSSLDDKIELNRQTNQTLEAIAQALFKEWFVAFNYPGATGEMQDSVLGEIPKGWKVGKLGEIALVVTGKTPSSNTPEHFGDYLPFITPTDFKNYGKLIISADRSVSEKGATALKNKILPIDSVIVTCIGSDMGKVTINKVACITNQQINSLIPNNNITADYLYYFLSSKYDLLRSIASGGSTMPIINKTQFEEIKIFIPCFQLLDRFQNVISPLNDFIENNLKETQTLIQLRDTLLPKLMKGEITIKS